ncbi:hypothetical protein MJO28_001819 [Puccinia striiformis f. sp. tritici]|uniref:PNPLA domain-containing protein n=2 Tax=Puccinia striiformis TaxID=27350 RepID=A0A2S4V594_9BASI|nr:hypothetical protein MJO28_001819 [Puccinia striiformis f. sp. tritici]POW04658.1 hypothetical protein PSHT_11147 [Puccinia striiformis]
MAEPTLPAFLQSVLALRPPLATSTRTNLAPSFQLLQSIVNTVYGAAGVRGLEPGLWRAQLIRATIRAAQIIQAVWTKLGGQVGVIVDDQGEDGRGVMRLQGVYSDLLMFIGSLTATQDPLTAILLDSVAFSRTQATVNTLMKKLSSLASHYEVADLLPTPLERWPEEDDEDRSEDLSALPLLIAKSRPTRAVLQKFEADCTRREQAELSNPDQPDGTTAPNDSTPASKTSTATPIAPSSFASSGLSSARRPEFLRFVYSQNPNLIAKNESLDTAVAAGTAALSSMAPPKPSISGLGKGPGGPTPRKSLVQQRISSFASSADAPPPLPAAAPIPLPARRVASDNQQNNSARKSWTVDMSGLNGIQRQSSLSVSKPATLTGPSSQISVAAPPVNWKPSISRPASTKSRSSTSGDPSDLNPAPKSQGSSTVSDGAPPEDSDGTSKALAKPTFAEQAAAIVAARKQRAIAQSQASSSQRTASQSSSATLTKDRPLSKSIVEIVSSAEAPTTLEDATPSQLKQSAGAPSSTALNPVPELTSSLDSQVSLNSGNLSRSTSSDRPPSPSTTTILNSPPPLSGPATLPPSSESTTSSAKTVSTAEPTTVILSASPAPVMAATIPSVSPPPVVAATIPPASPSPIVVATTLPSIKPSLTTARMNSSSSITPSASPAPVVAATTLPSVKPTPAMARMNSSSSTSSPKPQVNTLSPRSVNSLPLSPPPRSARRPSLAPPEPDLDFELVSDLIEHTSMLDVILAPEPDLTEPITLSSAASNDSVELEPNAAALCTDPDSYASKSSSVSAPPKSELSLNDLMKQASMYEDWTPDPDQAGTQLSRIDTSSSGPSHPVGSSSRAAQSDVLSAAFLSPPLSPKSPTTPASSAPEVDDGKSLSLKATSPMSQRPNHLALRTSDKQSFASLPEATRSEAVLTIAGSPPSTPSISGQSWATSLMSTPPAPSDFDWNLLNGNYYKTQLSVCLPPPEVPLKSGWRILCLDGGGIRGLSMLYVVRELMTSIQTRLRLHKAPLPCEIFEMICGVGTGGIIALLLGRLRLDISVAIEAYLQIVRQVFRQSKGVIAAVRKKSRFSATKLEAVIRDVVKRISGDKELLLADAGARPLCRTFVIAMRPSEGKDERGSMSKLKSYSERKVGNDGCSIAQAGRATSAAPLFFKAARADEVPFKNDSVPTSEVDLNNPSLEAVKEAQSLCPGRAIDCLVSLGAGESLNCGSGSIARACVEMAESSHRTARKVEAKAKKEGWTSNYFRCSVKGLKNEDNRGEWENPDWVKAGTVKYLFIDDPNQFERQVDNLTKSWKSSYDDDALRRILFDHGKGSTTPRSALFPSRNNGLAPRAEDLRRSISADLGEMQAKAAGPIEGSLRMFRSSHTAAIPPHSSPNTRVTPLVTPYTSSLYEGVGMNQKPQPTPPPSSEAHLTSFGLKLPEFNFSKT